MKVSVKKLDNGTAEILIDLEEEEIASYLKKASANISKNMQVPGFRQGKVPFNILKEKIGAMKIYEEAAKILAPEFYVKALIEKQVEAIGRPQIEITRLVPGMGISFKAITDILPEIKIPDYRKIKVKREKVSISNHDVENELKNLQKKQVKFITKKDKAKKGDRVEINFETFLGKEPLHGGKSENHPLIIGESYFVKGFDEELIGLKAGDEKEFSLVFPPDFNQKHLRGKKAGFKVKIKLVQKQILDEINDEFACSLGKFKNLDDLKKGLKEGILEERKRRVKEKARQRIIEKIIEQTDFSFIPPSLISAETEKIKEEFKAKISQFGADFNEYLKGLGKDEESFKEEMKEEALKRIKTSLVLREIKKKEKIEASEKEIIDKVNEILKFYQNEKEARKKFDLNELKEYTKIVILNQKTLDCLENLCVK